MRERGKGDTGFCFAIAVRIAVVAIGVVIGAVLASGCQSTTALRAWWADESATPAVVPITLAQGDVSPADTERLQAMIDEFGRANEAITVTLRAEDNYSTLLTRGTLPDADLIQVDAFLLPDLVEQNMVQPLPPSFLQDGLVRRDDFYLTLLDAFTLNGNLYCLPYEFRTLALVYNRALFDESGLAYPNAEWAWTEFRAAATAITETTNEFYSTYGLALTADASRWLPFLYQNGGGLLASDRQTTMLDSPDALEAMNFYLDLIADGAATTNTTFLSSWSGEAFGTGRIGMVIEGNWIVPYLASEFPDIDYGIVPLPTGSAGPATVAFSTCYALSAQTKNLTAALTFLRDLNSPSAMRILNQDSASAPARLSLQGEWLQQNQQMTPFLTAVDVARPWRFRSNFQLVIDSINSNMQRAIDAEIPAEEILRVAAELSSNPTSR